MTPQYQERQQFRGGAPQGGGPRGGDVPAPQAVKYFEKKDVMDRALVDQGAQDWAEKIRMLKTSQLRRFFDEVKAIERQVEIAQGTGTAPQEAFDRVRARFAMLKAKALYAKGRLKRDMPDEFVQFIVNHTHAVKTYEDFQAFTKHFEAVVGFHKFFARD